ncbi:sorting nexin mvp1 [Paracoccidioides lutzii Pb01]|uniref:Sorting nexin MVP1 n=1 Tax=Paracoccidioides lutzii (strain ATCC MYA-826 / Pb01) TaxID=502779 RepID=C1H437_PARBA|nr:sorting nexin mvp1 [Paracoccidioides lutzii Pb01]EEH34481.1 sorting nexin mvp1 [Paracoccidioides lutzii Pb01]
MSLFGTSPDDNPAAKTYAVSQSKSSLFSDQPAFGQPSSSSLFADDTPGVSSPWNSTNPKRAARHELVKMLLPASEVPESYIDAYDAVLDSGDKFGAGIAVEGARKVLRDSSLSSEEQATILNMVVPGGRDPPNGLGRGEFNVLLALIGLAQEGEDLTFDTIDERRKKLPRPNIPYVDELRSRNGGGIGQTTNEPHTPKRSPPRRMTQESPGDSDPWGSPGLHRGHNHSIENDTGPNAGVNEFDAAAHPPTNGFSHKTSGGYSGQPDSQNGGEHSEQPSENTPVSVGSGWEEGVSNPSGAGFGGAGHSAMGAGFVQPGDDQGNPNSNNNVSRSIGGGRVTSPGVDEVITINMLPEKEGMFLFQHRNYEVKSSRRGSSVIRRYSDFVWLVDCLQKRYPFRQIPLLPPKRVAVNGTHLAADSNSFLDKRRKGLVRFANSLVRHPVLTQEQLVVMFLTVPTELSVWRKQATISVQEEFTGKLLPPDLEDSLPQTLDGTFDRVHFGIKRSAEIYINLCNLLDRLVKRTQGLAADQFRISRALQALTDCTSDTYAVDTNYVPLLNNGINSTAKHLIASQGLLDDEAKAWNDGVLEDFKMQRDCYVAMRDLFDRRDRYAKDNIPQLERRIESNERKLQNLRSRPEGTVKPGEVEKVEDSIIKDKKSIVQQHARGVFIKECIRDELLYFQMSQYHVSRLHQDWSQERVKYAELQADNWRSLCVEVEAMPTSD